MNTDRDLKILLQKIDRKSYPAYKDTKGSYDFGGYILSIDHVQGDPFAGPSDVSICVAGKKSAFPKECYDTREKRTALEDYLLRRFGRRLAAFNRVAGGSGKSGAVAVTRPGQEILERTACMADAATGSIRVRLHVGFPANGRTINSGALGRILFEFLPDCVENTLYYENYDAKGRKEMKEACELAEDQAHIRRLLKEQGLVAFVADGAVLPRESGASDRPMKDAVGFVSPASMEVTLDLPNRGKIRGMGIKKGITLIVGGGYHGKSTLLKALELGVYNHIAGDGREFVITDAAAVKSRAEDGRSVRQVDISMFIGNLPNGRDTASFDTEDASGSTSQAAGVAESIEAGAKVFLMDEDTSATNFMIRDELMQRVVLREQEPIIPFIDRVRELYEAQGISTILVAGSSGSYFYVADTIIQMDRYRPVDITERAKREAAEYRGAADGRCGKGGISAADGKDGESGINAADSKDAGNTASAVLHHTHRRIPLPAGVFREPRLKIKTFGMDSISIDRESIDLRLVEQLVDAEQLCALGQLLKYAQLHLIDGKRSLSEVVELLEKTMDEKGIDEITKRPFARPRPQEIAACFNRYRGQAFR